MSNNMNLDKYTQEAKREFEEKKLAQMKELTKKQKKLLDFCIKNAKIIPPTYEEMSKFMKVIRENISKLKLI